MPSIPELQLLVPQGSNASRGPQPAHAAAAMTGATHSTAAASRRRERSTLWQDSMAFSDSFFSSQREFETGHGDLRPLGDAGDGPAAMVPDAFAEPRSLRH